MRGARAAAGAASCDSAETRQPDAARARGARPRRRRTAQRRDRRPTRPLGADDRPPCCCHPPQAGRSNARRGECRGGPPRARRPRQVAPVTTTDTSTELLERARELSMLGEYLEAVQRSSRGRVLLIGGEAGVGKTALLRRFCDDWPGGARFLWGACDALFTPRPLGPFADIAESTGGELEELVQTGARPYEIAAALMRELRTRSPAVLVLEDVHSADEATLDVLRLLVRRVE